MTADPDGRSRLRNPSPLRAYLELVRLPNVFTAMADPAMGFLLVRAVDTSTDGRILGLAIAAASLLYASGVVLNDVFDLKTDAQQRPERPLPSGRVPPAVARWLGWELMVLGLAVAWAAAFLAGDLRAGIVATLLAACIVLYDGPLKRTPLGPVAMGACRMLNVLLGATAAAGPWRTEYWMVAAGVGTYVAGVTWLARAESRLSSRLQLGLATAVMMLGIVALARFADWQGRLADAGLRRYQLLMTLLGMLIGWRCLRAVLEPVPRRVQMAVKHAILSLVVLDAAVCYAARGPTEAVLVLLLLLPAMTLGRWIYST